MPVFNGRGLRNVWPVLFFLGAAFLNRPFIGIFDKPERVLGIPVLFYYMFGGWAFSIGVIYLFSRVLYSRDKGGEG